MELAENILLWLPNYCLIVTGTRKVSFIIAFKISHTALQITPSHLLGLVKKPQQQWKLSCTQTQPVWPKMREPHKKLNTCNTRNNGSIMLPSHLRVRGISVHNLSKVPCCQNLRPSVGLQELKGLLIFVAQINILCIFKNKAKKMACNNLWGYKPFLAIHQKERDVQVVQCHQICVWWKHGVWTGSETMHKLVPRKKSPGGSHQRPVWSSITPKACVVQHALSYSSQWDAEQRTWGQQTLSSGKHPNVV